MMTNPQKNKKEFEQGLNVAMRYLSYQPRTKHETVCELEKKHISDDIIRQVIHYLQNHNFINDWDFARLYIESKEKYKPRSKFAFRYMLKQKGIDSQIIDSVLESYDDEVLARKAIALKLKIWQNFDTDVFQKKAMNHLKYRGFSFDVCLSTINYFLEAQKTGNEHQTNY